MGYIINVRKHKFNFVILENLIHISIYLIITFIFFRLKIIPFWIAFFLIITSISPFWFNYLLFPPNYMPDQFKYFRAIVSFRELNFSLNFEKVVNRAGLLLSIIPLPFITNLFGVAYINKIIHLFLFTYLYRNKYLEGGVIYFFLFYPDILIYSSLALRDTLILTFMLLGTTLLIKRKFLLSLLIFLLLVFIKFQNFLLMLILWLLYVFFMRKKVINSVKSKYYFFFLIFFLLSIAILVIPNILDEINFYRRAMFIEDGGMIDDLELIHTSQDFLLLGIKSSFMFLFKPFLYEVNNAFQLIQSLINICVVIFLFFFTKKCYKIKRVNTLFWLTLQWKMFCIFYSYTLK